MIAPLKKLSSEEKNHRSKQNSSDTLSRKFFSDILEDACEKEQQKDIQIYTNGYTKNALPFCNFVNMREYR